VFPGPLVSLPGLFPFGWPHFDLLATLPLLIFSAISMAEATSQTVAIGEIVGRSGAAARADVPKTIRGDALMSLLGGCLGTSLIITSGENIGIVRATGIRSRYVTATAGALLIAAALFAPFARLANAIPGPVVGGTALIVFAIIGTMGIDMLRRSDLHAPGQMFTLAASLAIGLLPILVPGLYSQFPANAQMILGNGLAMGTLTAVLCTLLFREPAAPTLSGAAAEASHAD
jgi:xanthine/uracil permease